MRPSNAVWAMVLGIDGALARDDFTIDMGTFGESYDGMCYGCAATCALQQITEKWEAEEHYTDWFHRNAANRQLLEGAIDSLRHTGNPHDLFLADGLEPDPRFCDPNPAVCMEGFLDADEWRDHFKPYYSDLATRLADAGY